MTETRSKMAVNFSWRTPTLENVSQVLEGLEGMEETLAVGIFGSLARGGFGEKSDIDVLVVMPEGSIDDEELEWHRRIKKALWTFGRNVTVLFYNEKALRNVCTWYVLRLARDAKLVHDPGGRIARLFEKIIDAAHRAGLREVEMAGRMVWTKPDARVGEIWEFKLEDDD